jgi:hypothetical protein
MSMTSEGKSYRSFVRLLVRLTSWSKENDKGGKKVMAKKIILLSIGVWNLECIGVHCWRSVWAGAIYLHFKSVSRHVSPWCQHNSEYAGWFCPDGSVCSIPDEKVPLFLGPEFAFKRDTRPTFKFSMKEDVLPAYRMMSKMPSLLV